MTCISGIEYKQLKEEVLSAQQQLKTLCSQLRQSQCAANGRDHQRQRHASTEPGAAAGASAATASADCAASVASCSSSDDDYTLNSVHVGRLNEVVLELKGLLHGMLRRGMAVGSLGSGSSSSGNYSGNCSLVEPDPAALKMEADLHRSNEQCEKLSMSLKQSEVDIKKRDDEINQQLSKLSVLEVELAAVKEERDTYKDDMDNSSLSKDQLIKKAWEVRDAAVKRKNTAEIDLAKERIATMQINSQLLEAIKQKVELSQQLDQWQGDMEQLLEEQMRERLQQGERKRGVNKGSVRSSDHSPGGSGRTSRLLSIVNVFNRNS